MMDYYNTKQTNFNTNIYKYYKTFMSNFPIPISMYMNNSMYKCNKLTLTM